ncbi:MAG TPA: pinensin family lanthipeptide [Longimicrobium sp.]|jgi:hypothetical protein
MKKMKLQLEALRVESFATAAAAPARGTVRGNAAAVGCNTDAPDCDPITCGPSCIGPCTSNGYAAADSGTEPIIVGSANELCTDPSYVETCIFYTCGGCTSDDPAYC